MKEESCGGPRDHKWYERGFDSPGSFHKCRGVEWCGVAWSEVKEKPLELVTFGAWFDSRKAAHDVACGVVLWGGVE